MGLSVSAIVRVGQPTSLIISSIGIVSNTISIFFFYKIRQIRRIGDKFLIFLNVVDILICVISLVLVLLDLLYEEYQNSAMEENNFWGITYFSILIEISGLATCYLCALRAISIVWPLHLISSKKVYASTVLPMVYIVAGKLPMFIEPDLKREATESSAQGQFSLPLQISFFNISIMVVFVMICLIVSIRGLKKARPERAGQGTDTNKKATKMILILGLIFLTFNSAWMGILASIIETDWVIKEEDMEEVKVPVQMLTYVISSINSAANPAVYMTRNEEMNKYIKQLISQVKSLVCAKRSVLTDCFHIIPLKSNSSRVAISDLSLEDLNLDARV